MCGTKFGSALHPAGSILQRFPARPHPALTRGRPPPRLPQKAPPARAGGTAWGGVRGVQEPPR
eukprot:7605630-Alexandrium_andersonii.AAC.1